MPRLIDADALRERMYHDAFETDSDMQKWDSGCWIRYKMFENALEEAPTVNAVEVVRCKDCQFSCTPKWNSDEVYCTKHDNWFKINGYCHLGRRKDAETN